MLLEQNGPELCQRVRADIVSAQRMRSRSSIVSATTSLSSASDFSRKERVGSSTSLMSSRTSSSGIRKTGEIHEG